MVAGSVGPDNSHVTSLAEREFGLCVYGPAGGADLHAGDAICAAIEGAPRWRSQRFAEIAERDGHAAALASAYGEIGAKLFDELAGPCALIVLDRVGKRAIVAIDRIGVRPICYAPTDDGGIVFGSTTDSIRAHPHIVTTLNHQAISDYLFLTRVPAPETVYNEISKLMPGQYLSHDGGRSDVRFYWELSYDVGETKSHRGFDELASELKELLGAAFDRTLQGLDATSTGAFLSGGVDSSTVVGMLHDRVGDAATAFTIGFNEQGYDELEFARSAARHYGVRHYEYTVTPRDVMDAAPKIAEVYDEPYGNSSAVAAFYCARLAKEHGVTALLAGDGGDEIFAGNERYARQRIFELYYRLPTGLRRVIEPLVRGLPGGSLFLVRKAKSYVEQASTCLPDRLEIRNNYLNFSPAECFKTEIGEHIRQLHAFDLMRYHYHGAKARTALNRMMHLDLRMTLADDDLRKVNRTTECQGLLVRYPLLDEELVEFAARVPPDLKLKSGQLRYFFKRALKDYLPASVLEKSKHGFGLPFGQWQRSRRELKEFTYDNVGRLKSRGLFNPEFPDAVLERHRTGHAAYHGELVWLLLMLELWFQSHEKAPTRRAGA